MASRQQSHKKAVDLEGAVGGSSSSTKHILIGHKEYGKSSTVRCRAYFTPALFSSIASMLNGMPFHKP
jgi:hypothetical protein